MQEIIINGVNLTELKAKQAAYNAEVEAVRNTIRQGAAAFIAERITEAKAAVEKLKEATGDTESPADETVIVTLAKEATEALVQAEFVSGISGVSYALPFSDNSYAYGGYSSDDIITCVLEDIEINGQSYWDLGDNTELGRAIDALYNQAETMEGEVQEWNSSYC